MITSARDTMDKRRGQGRSSKEQTIKPETRTDELSKARKRKKRGGAAANFSLMLTAALVFVFVSAYMVSGLSARLQTPEIATISPGFGNIAQPTIFSGVIVRDETVYTADRAGIVEFSAGHLERVRPRQAVASISDEVYVADVAENIEELDRMILEMQARRGDISAFSADVTRMNEQLQASVDSHIPRVTGQSFEELHDFADNARHLLNLRNQMLLTESRGSVQSMVSERERAVQRRDNNISHVAVDRGGILSYIVDGLEDILTIENLRGLEPEQTRQSVDYTTLLRRREVAEGDSVFKVVNSNTWFIAAYLPFEAVADWQANDLRRVYLQTGDTFRQMETYVEHIDHTQAGSFVVLRLSRFLTDFMDRRDINFRLSNIVRDSLKIPSHVVSTMDAVRIPAEFVHRADAPNPSVVRRSNDGSPDQSSQLHVYRRNSEFVYALTAINNLTIGDRLAHPDYDQQTHIIDEIVLIRGVFVLNFGFADFVEINVGEDITVIDDHIVIEASANRRVTPSSQIILDPTGLRDGQRLMAY